MDTLLQIVAVDRRVKGYLRRSATCRKCSSEIAPGTSRVRGLCAACAAKRRPAHR
jgi:hypothetical protein